MYDVKILKANMLQFKVINLKRKTNKIILYRYTNIDGKELYSEIQKYEIYPSS